MAKKEEVKEEVKLGAVGQVDIANLKSGQYAPIFLNNAYLVIKNKETDKIDKAYKLADVLSSLGAKL